jgi:hypothetical protein
MESMMDLPVLRDKPVSMGTLAEMARRYGVARNTPLRWRERRATNGFPAPAALLRQDRVAGNLKNFPPAQLYLWADVDRWRREYVPAVGAAAHRGGPKGGWQSGNQEWRKRA